jgi:putative aminopeptidase FrvX
MTTERSQQLIALCQALIQSQSYSGHEDGVVKRMKQAFNQWDVD